MTSEFAHNTVAHSSDRLQGLTKDLFDRSAHAALIIGTTAIVLAIVLFAWPGKTLTVVAYLFATYLLVTGITQVASTFGGGLLRSATGWWRLLSLLSGALSVLFAVVAYRNVALSLVILAIFLGVNWLFRGITSLSVVSDLPNGAPGKLWGIALAVLTIFAGATVVIWPASSIGALALLAEILLIVIGVTEIAHGVQIRSAAKRLLS